MWWIKPVDDVAPEDFLVREDGTRRRLTPYFGAPHIGYSDSDVGPQAFAVDYDPPTGGGIGPHFHPTMQFQVVIRGAGRIGRHEVAPYAFHFADTQVPYGPITPEGPGGISFLTLRPVGTGTTHWMPEDRAHRQAGRNEVGLHTAGPITETDVAVTPIIHDHDDGLAGYGVALPAGYEGQSDWIDSAGSGRYYVVTSGRVNWSGHRLRRHSLVFHDGVDAADVTSDSGSTVLILQFPTISPEPDAPRIHASHGAGHGQP